MSWGPCFWRCIHYMAIHGKKDIIDKIPIYLPCDICKEEWFGPMEGEDLVDWSIRLHNKVNAKLGKWDKWDRIDFNISNKPTCDICEGREHQYLFPWTFLYSIDTEFVMEFVSEYPCDTCRGKLVVDLPRFDEIHIDWVHRNHTQFNLERGLYVPQPLIQVSSIPPTCSGCNSITPL